MTLTFGQRVVEAMAAAYGGIWVHSYEHEDAIKTIRDVCGRQGWPVLEFDYARGLITEDSDSQLNSQTTPNLMQAISALRQAKDDKTRTVLVVRNAHLGLFGPDGRITNPLIMQHLQLLIEEGGADRMHFIGVSYPEYRLPVELEKHMFVVDHDFPDDEEMWSLAQQVCDPEDLPEEDSREAALLMEAASGLTRMEALGAFALSLVRDKKIATKTIWELKAQAIQRGGLLKVYKGGETFDQIGGLEPLKDFALRCFNSPNLSELVKLCGVMLVGASGTGKSAWAKALGNEVNRPTVIFDLGALKGSLVGQSEANIRRALATVDKLAPCIMFIDEVEKALSGATDGGHDSGVSSGMLGTLLTWMNDHTSDVYCVFTANDVSKLPPEFSRAERLDGVFCMELPTAETKKDIWSIYRKLFGIPEDNELPKDDEWTGAEIRTCCRLARMQDMSLVEAANNVVPVAIRAKEKLLELRKWAHNRCLSADYPGVYKEDGPAKPKGKKARRSVHRGNPENN